MRRDLLTRTMVDFSALIVLTLFIVAADSVIVGTVVGYLLGASAVARLKWIYTGEWRWP